MALLTPRYTAPLPPGFISGTIELKSQTTYIDKDGRVNQPFYLATIGSNNTLTNTQNGQLLQIVGMGQGDPGNASPLDVVVTLVVAGLPTPLRPTFSVLNLDTGGGMLNLHAPNINVPLIGPLPATLQALIDQATQSEALLAAAIAAAGQGSGGGGGGTGTGTIHFASPAQLVAAGLTDGQAVTLDAMSPGSGLGGGQFIWRAFSSAAPDGGGVFTATDQSTGRFIRTAHTLSAYTPEDFGARGDNVYDDYPAFMNLTRAVTLAKGGSVTMRLGAQYYYGQYIDNRRTAGQGPQDEWRDIPIFRQFVALRVDMNGATITAMRGVNRTQGTFLFTGPYGKEYWSSPISSISCLSFAYGEHLIVMNGKCDGNARATTRWEVARTSTNAQGYQVGGKILNETYSQGFQAWGVDDATFINVDAFDCLTDGFQLNASEVWGADGVTPVTNATRTLNHRVVMINCKSKQNRRQGMSVIGARNLTAINCDFSETGITGFDTTTGAYLQDAYGWHEPGAGVDIEPYTSPVNPNTVYRVLETTGDILFLNTRFENNFNGPFVATYSDKIHGNIGLKNCVIDGHLDTFPDSYVIMPIGVTMDDCEIKLPPNGFLWQDPTADNIRQNELLRSTVRNSRIHITRDLGYFPPNHPQVVEIENNNIWLPLVFNLASSPIQLLDRYSGVYNKGATKLIRYQNNTHHVNYSYRANDNSQTIVAFMEGIGMMSGNRWILEGTRPGTLGTLANWLVLTYTGLGAGNANQYLTYPTQETFQVPVGAPQTDWHITTPSIEFSGPVYTFTPKTVDYIPFGLPGVTPVGTTQIMAGRIKGGPLITGILASWNEYLTTKDTCVLNVYVNDVKVATGTWTTSQTTHGSDRAMVFTGLPLQIYPEDQALQLEVVYGQSVSGGYVPSNLSGYLTTEEYK
jgi:hypothetical protein